MVWQRVGKTHVENPRVDLKVAGCEGAGWSKLSASLYGLKCNTKIY